MLKRSNFLLFAALALISLGTSLLGTSASLAAPTAEQVRESRRLSGEIRKAQNLLTQGKFAESSEIVQVVLSEVEKMAEGNDREIIDLLKPIHRRVIRVHALLELEGIELPLVGELGASAEDMPEGGGVSFTKQIAPMLVSRCGGCHVTGRRGDFSMANYETLMTGPEAGVVIFKEDAAGSTLVSIIESGDMPRGGGRVDEDELNLLKKWIDEGAKYDGDDPRMSLMSFAPTGGATGPMLTISKPKGNESVSFARHIAPVLAQNCNGCHVNGRRPRGNLNMSNFAGIVRGGDNGPVVRPRDPQQSLLIQHLKGENGLQRMPVGRPALADDVIAVIERWIMEGAAYDGATPNQDIVRVAALARAREMTHEELTEDRTRLAKENWRLGMNNVEAAAAESKNFLLMGNLGESTLEGLATKAESLAPKVATMLGAPSERPLLKGRMTLFVFNQRYDYSEFGQMVERRELPKEWKGHWRYDVVDAYGAMIAPRTEESEFDGLVGQQLAGAYVASLGNPPRWFSEGTARMVASKVSPRDKRVAGWNDALPGVLAAMNRPADLIQGRMPAEDRDVASFSFVSFLAQDSRRFGSLLNALRQGQDFTKSFALVYGGNPDKVTELWARYVVSNAGRTKKKRRS